MRISRVAIPLVLVSLLAACSGDDPKAIVVDDPDRPTPEPRHAALEVIGPEGGTLALDAITVTIPPNALTATVAITIDPAEQPPEGEPAGPWYELGPAGIVFEVPIEIAIELDPGDVVDGATPTVSKYLSHAAREGDGPDPVTAVMQLDTTWDGEARVATGATIGFSRVGVSYGHCPTSAPTPRILRAEWNACTRRTFVAWESEAPLFIEYGYRQGYGAPVTWSWGWRANVREHEFPALVRQPGPGQSAYTWIIKMHTQRTCGGTTYVSGDAVAEVPGLEILPPDPPENVSARRFDLDHVELTWRAPSAIESQEDGYEISRSPAFSSMAMVEVGPADRFDDRDVDATSDYFYNVRSVHTTCGRRMTSRWVSASTSANPSPPDDVRGFTAIAESASAVNLSWNAAARATEYVLSRLGGAPFADVILSAPATSWRDETVEAGIAYTYTLRARNSDGTSAPVTAVATTPMTSAGTAVCGDLRLTVSPTSRTTRVQENNCNPGDPGCPDDAVYDVTVERLGGATGDVQLSTLLSPDSWPISEFQLGAFGGRSGSPRLDLTSGAATEATTYEIRTPSYAFSSTPAPLTWQIAIVGQMDGGPQCEVPIELIVTE